MCGEGVYDTEANVWWGWCVVGVCVVKCVWWGWCVVGYVVRVCVVKCVWCVVGVCGEGVYDVETNVQ